MNSWKLYHFQKSLSPAHGLGLFLNADKNFYAQHFFCVAIPQSPEESLVLSVGSSAENAFENLKNKIQGEIHTHLATQEFFHGLYFDSKKIFLVPENSAPVQIIKAQELISSWCTRTLENLKCEYPLIPWASSALAQHLTYIQNSQQIQIYNPDHALVSPLWNEINRKKKILLHVCCGPDAAGVINQLKRDYDVVCFWYDPNIQPVEEYNKRLDAFKIVADVENVPYIVGEYDVERFFDLIKGLEHTPEQGAKCSICYDMRLERSAIEAAKENCDLFATTLAISPHKVQEKLKNFGELSARRHKIKYFHKNFMKDHGFNKSVEYTKQYNIYRQDYCGCLYSLFEGGLDARKLAKELKLEKDDLNELAKSRRTPT